MQEFIDRFGAKNTKASQAQSMAKKIEKMDKIEPVKNTTPKVKFNFDVEQQSGKVVVTINNIEMSNPVERSLDMSTISSTSRTGSLSSNISNLSDKNTIKSEN